MPKIELLNQCEAMMYEIKSETEAIRYASVLSQRFNTTAFKKVTPKLYRVYTKLIRSCRFTISL